MRLVEIQEAIERRKLCRTSGNLKSTLATALKREKRFELISRGVYRLRE